MIIPDDAVLLRIYIGESDRCEKSGDPLYERILMKAREERLAGATVLRGVLGYGKSSRIHSAKILALSSDLPLVVEIVDSREKIELFLPWLDEHVKEGLVTLEKVQVLHYRGGPPQKDD